MLNVAVVDDEQAHRDILLKYIEEWADREQIEIRSKAFQSAEAFYFEWCGDQRYDVLFLDIMMEGTDGLKLARRLREKGKQISIVFTTGIADYMQDGYEVEAMHYLLKPLDKEKVWGCLEKCLDRKKEEKLAVLPVEDGLIRVDVNQILYAEAAGHYCELTRTDGMLSIKEGIRELCSSLSEYGSFIFCHRSYVVNVRRILRIGRTELIMDSGMQVPVSRRMYQEVNRSFIEVFTSEKKTGRKEG